MGILYCTDVKALFGKFEIFGLSESDLLIRD